jgi:hypothetical protein
MMFRILSTISLFVFLGVATAQAQQPQPAPVQPSPVKRTILHDNVDHVNLRALVRCAFIVNGTVWKGQRLTWLEDAFRLAVGGKPEFPFNDLPHNHARMRMAPGLERWSNLYHRVHQFKVGAGDVGSLTAREKLAAVLSRPQPFQRGTST